MTNNSQHMNSEAYMPSGFSDNTTTIYETVQYLPTSATSSHMYVNNSNTSFNSNSNTNSGNTKSDRSNAASKRNTMYNFNFSSSNTFASATGLTADPATQNSRNLTATTNPEYLNVFYKLLNTYNINLNASSKSSPSSNNASASFKTQDESAVKARKTVKRNQSLQAVDATVAGSHAYLNSMSVNFNHPHLQQQQAAFLSSPFGTVSGYNLKPSSKSYAAASTMAKDNILINGSLFTSNNNNNNKLLAAQNNNNNNMFNKNNPSNQLNFSTSNQTSQPTFYDQTSYGVLPSKLIPQTQPFDISIRFAVNGISKYAKATSAVPSNRSIQAGDFGDDAGMVAENSRCLVIGLADGAGGNRSIGIDPQKFSRSLLGYCVEIIKNEDVTYNHMAKLACKSIQILESKDIRGSGTLCLLGINKTTNIMHSLNIGDSGFRVIRQGEIVHRSQATMSGSSPRQLYVSDSSTYSNISFVNEEEIIQDSDIREFQVQKDDLIVLSSDGMFDVVQDSAIIKAVNSNTDKNLQTIADELLVLSMKSYVYTQRDDILVMVCRVEPKK